MTKTPKERPILFSAPMVRAILDDAKTQTRRLLKLPNWSTQQWDELEIESGPCLDTKGETFWPCIIAKASGCLADIPCPYGAPGDRLWVKETWYDDLFDRKPGEVNDLHYRADHDCADWEAGCPCRDDAGRSCWKSARLMPRWASRLLLEVVSVRVERLQEITEEDAIAEGIAKRETASGFECDGVLAVTARDAFEMLWDRVNGKTSPWADNPWVFVVEFRRVP